MQSLHQDVSCNLAIRVFGKQLTSLLGASASSSVDKGTGRDILLSFLPDAKFFSPPFQMLFGDVSVDEEGEIGLRHREREGPPLTATAAPWGLFPLGLVCSPVLQGGCWSQ